MPKPPISARAAFNLCAGHPVLDLVNTLDNRFAAAGPSELLADYGDLLSFVAQSGLLSAAGQRLLARVKPEAGLKALRSAQQLREAAAAVLYAAVDGHAPRPADVRTLEHHFLEAMRHRKLHWERYAREGQMRGEIRWGWDGVHARAQLPVWLLASATSDLLLSRPLERLRACAVETCRWLFLDTSKNHTRRWCDMRVCGNRMKAQRFLARREDSR
ncbi:MAG TPA: CGNR zinc finger domain-containing protein [Steroidobacteraceae bacterium]|jgi:predicted RNA-binding Zn ribbon-like protein